MKGTRKRQRKTDSTEEDEDEGDETQSEGAETPDQGERKEPGEPSPSLAAGHKPLHSSLSFPFMKTTPTTEPDLTSRPLLKTPPVPRRASVIKRIAREDSGSAKLQMQADILKFHGNILTHTGNLFSYHADLINKDKPGSSVQTGPGLIKQEIKTEEGGGGGGGGFWGSFQRQQSAPAYCDYLAVKEEQPADLGSPAPVEDEEFSDVLADKIFQEAQELIQNSPWILEPGG